ncbi:hypothetical protein M6B38_262620 [Iris pallida]|uniref:Uncharacterized protein n=1 Tax=Iris pallida TaxID=29817 RepID=A0AAX6ICL7_IRIPA|nr:hypothetical protein M6B38_263145 [Iris pallida]KAJ6850992.1 hypothetical protein M6B38_262620 [Iris pallida]
MMHRKLSKVCTRSELRNGRMTCTQEVSRTRLVLSGVLCSDPLRPSGTPIPNGKCNDSNEPSTRRVASSRRSIDANRCKAYIGPTG